jgi:type II secretion system protein J
MSRPNGFTLIELLVGITVLVMVLAAAYASCSIAVRTCRKIEKESCVDQNMRQAWRVVSRDLRCAFISASNRNIQFIGERRREGTDSSDKLTFVTYLPDTRQGSGGLAKVSYYINRDPRLPCAGLLREDRAFPVAAEENGAGKIQVIAPLATSFRLRYFNGTAWQEQWGVNDAQAHVLPVAVEVQVKVSDDTNTSVSGRTLTTIVPVLSN